MKLAKPKAATKKAAVAEQPTTRKSNGYGRRGGELEVVVHQKLYTEEGREGRKTVLRLVSYVNDGKPSKESPMLEYREFYPNEDGEILAGKAKPIPGRLVKALFGSKKNQHVLDKMMAVIAEELANKA